MIDSFLSLLRVSASLRFKFLLGVASCVAAAGCGTPNAANIELRKQNQTLQSQVDQLTDQHHRDVDTLAATERARPTISQLPPDRLAKLTTTHGLSFGRLTGGDNPDATQSFDTQLKVAVVPVDEEGTPIKAAGSFKIEAFDLDDPAKPLLGTWNFDLEQTRASFYNRFALYTYVLVCPFQKKPEHQNVTVHVTFDDALTGRQFVDQVRATVRLPATRP